MIEPKSTPWRLLASLKTLLWVVLVLCAGMASANRTVDPLNLHQADGLVKGISAEDGCFFLRARWMDPNTGRFVSEDPYVGDVEGPVSLHRYLYGNENPTDNSDPNGLYTLSEVTVSQNSLNNLQSLVRFANFVQNVAGKVQTIANVSATIKDLVSALSGGEASIFGAALHAMKSGLSFAGSSGFDFTSGDEWQDAMNDFIGNIGKVVLGAEQDKSVRGAVVGVYNKTTKSPKRAWVLYSPSPAIYLPGRTHPVGFPFQMPDVNLPGIVAGGLPVVLRFQKEGGRVWGLGAQTSENQRTQIFRQDYHKPDKPESPPFLWYSGRFHYHIGSH